MRVEIQCRRCGKRAQVEAGHGVVPCPGCGADLDRPELLTTLPDDPTRPIRPAGQPDGFDPSLFAGRYQFLKLLGEGGMGRVELHLDTWMNRKVALKVPNARAVVKPKARERFLREVQTLVKVRNENVCHVLDVSVTHDPIFFTMEYLEGEPLDAVLDRRGALPPAEAAGLVRTVALALADTHDKQVVHRDLKPSNILMVENRPILIDFGLALDLDDRSVANAGSLKGTIQYMSPEQAKGENDAVGPASDIFSLGIILYQLLTGELPFQADSHVGILSQIMMLEPEPPSKVKPGLDPRFDAICSRAMSKEIGKRFATMREFADALGAILGPPAKAAPVDPSTWSSIPIEVDPEPTRSRVPAWVYGLVGALALAVTIGLVFLRRGAEPTPPVPPPVPGADRIVTPRPDPAPAGKGKSFGDSIGLVMVDIPAGSFEMGITDARAASLNLNLEQSDKSRIASARPSHKVEITKPFAMSAYETTVGQFQAFVDDAKYRTEGERSAEGGWGLDQGKRAIVQAPRFTWKRPGFPTGEKYPVCVVSWNDAVAFCKWLTEKSAGEGVIYRLPTEAEWEYACRAGTTTPYSFGEDARELSKYGNYALQKLEDVGRTKVSKKASSLGFDGFLHTAPVGSLRPNPWGLYDMHGNVMEWCQDLFDATYYEISPAKDPQGPESVPGEPRRVLRGGSWSQPLPALASATRMSAEQDDRSATKGFRVVRVRKE